MRFRSLLIVMTLWGSFRTAQCQATGALSADTAQAYALARLFGLARDLPGRVLTRNAEILAQRATVAAAEARYFASGFTPAAILNAESEEMPGGLNITQANTRLTLEREIMNGGRRRAARALANADVWTGRATLSATVQRTVANTARTYLAAIGWRIIVERLVAEDSLLASADASLRARFAAAQARYVDVLRIRTERLRVESGIASARAEATAARLAFAALLGGDITATQLDSALVTVADSIASGPGGAARPTFLVRDTLPAPPNLDSLVAASPLVRAADAAVASAEAARAAALAAQRPIVTAFVGGQRFLRENDGLTFGPVFGASVSLPFTALRANRASALAAERGIAAARASRAAAVASLRSESGVALARYEAARQRVSSFSTALLRGARQEREAALASYRGGELSLLELIDFERALTLAENDRVRAVIDAVDALASLLAPAMSGNSPATSITINPGASDAR